jgi:hypothetical protein
MRGDGMSHMHVEFKMLQVFVTFYEFGQNH